jgi:hypothetical protein
MTTLSAAAATELEHKFSRARLHLLRARLRRAQKDTPANRAAVAVCMAHIDAVLDRYLDVRRTAP